MGDEGMDQSMGMVNLLAEVKMDNYQIDKKKAREIVKRFASLYRNGDVDRDVFQLIVRLALEKEFVDSLEGKLDRASRKNRLFQ
jgi:hypothetical protein